MGSDWGLEASEELMEDPDALFTLVGAMYILTVNLVQLLNAVRPSSAGGLKFSPPRSWRPEWTAQLSQQRWRPVTLRKLQVAGAMKFCWLRPDELVGGTEEAGSFTSGKFGAF